MQSSMIFLNIVQTLLITSLSQVVEGGSALEVTAPAGTFVGTVLMSTEGEIFKAFLGIPYAVPPEGNLRFAKPKPYPKLKETFKATQNAPICIQMAGIDLGSPTSEDCLYLNVYTPMSDNNMKQSEDSSLLKKVFVYIHGGGFYMGSANEHVPGDWVVRGNVIVVTLNYRLGWLGFVKGNTPEAPGNLGFWDQLTALKWVKDNIRSFGGDPDDIAIGGNSAGSFSVSVLTITPYSKDLFTKAVMLSYTVFNNTSGSSDHLLYDLADTLGCGHSSRDQSEANRVVQCLRKLPAQAFSLPWDGRRLSQFAAVDGDLLPAPVPELIHDEDYLGRIGFYSRDYISSVTPIEGVVLVKGVFAVGTEEEVMNPEFLHQFTKLPLPVAVNIINWYKHPSNYEINPAYELYGDLALLMPSVAFAEVFASVNRDTYTGKIGSSYFLVYNFTPTYTPEGYQGFFHALELSYIFDVPPSKILNMYYRLNTDKGFTEDDKKLKMRFIDALTSFVKTGNPGISLTDGALWPTFDLDTEYYLELTPEPVLKQFPFRQRRQLWNKDLLSYLQDYARSEGRTDL